MDWLPRRQRCRGVGRRLRDARPARDGDCGPGVRRHDLRHAVHFGRFDCGRARAGGCDPGWQRARACRRRRNRRRTARHASTPRQRLASHRWYRASDRNAVVIAVLGAGGWGTALAVHLVRTGHDAWLWGRDASLIAELRARRANAVYLPDITFPPRLKVTSDLEEALDNVNVIVAAVPSHGMRDVLRRAAPLVRDDAIVVSAAKGLEQDTLFRPSEIVQQELGAGVRVGVLSGPSFASEMARELPTAVCIASANTAVVEQVQADFRAPYFRLYGTSDVVGV